MYVTVAAPIVPRAVPLTIPSMMCWFAQYIAAASGYWIGFTIPPR